MSTNTRPISWLIHRSICPPTHLGRHIDRHSTDMSTDISADNRPLCRPIHRSSVGRYVDRDVDRYIGRGVHKIHMIPRFCRNLILGAASHHPSQQGYSHAEKDTSNKGILESVGGVNIVDGYLLFRGSVI